MEFEKEKRQSKRGYGGIDEVFYKIYNLTPEEIEIAVKFWEMKIKTSKK